MCYPVHEALSDRMDWKQTNRLKEDSKLPASCALWPLDLKLIHIECNPGDTLVHFQGQYATVCELDYNILQEEIQNAIKTTVSVEIGDLCLVEDLQSRRWYRGRVQSKSGDLFDVFLLDHGTVLTVGSNHLSAVSDFLLMLPPKIVCGFLANVLPVQEYWNQLSKAYFSSLIGQDIKGYIYGLLPYKVHILEVPEITKDLLRLDLGRHVDTDTFLLLVELMMEVPIQQSCESVPDLLLEKQRVQEFYFKSSNLLGYENILSLNGITLVVGQKESVRISAAVNLGLFYCQLSSTAKDLKEMSDKLALICESGNGTIRDEPCENMGLLCTIKGKDEKWHRGLVQCLPVNSQVQVVFVDYGYCESVKVENIFQLPSDFLLRPVMTFPCSLSCLGNEDKATMSQQKELLRKGLMGTELVITVDDLNVEKNVCLVTLSEFKYADIKTVHSKELERNVHQVSCFLPETQKVAVFKNFEHIQEGSLFEGYVEYVQSPHDFWMRTAKSNDRFEAMMNKLSDRFNGLQLNEEILHDPVRGQLCCAMYENDMHYYRALVVDILKHGAEVFFIDFGNTEKVPSMLIKKIPTEFTVEPAFAHKCSLAHVVSREDVWTTVATNFFSKATSNKRLLVRVLYRKSDVFVVELYENELKRSESIATLLTRANMAEYWAYSVMQAPARTVEKNNKAEKKLRRATLAKNSWKSMSQKLSIKDTRQETVPDKRVNSESRRCSAADAFRHLKFNPGTVISVACSQICSPSEFWCQNTKNKNDLDSLMKRLQRFYHTNTTVLQPQSVCCAVQLRQDNKWYRGCILQATDRNVKVILADYGMVVQEKRQNLRALDPEFLELEGQAFLCSLDTVIYPVKEDVWSDRATTLLRNFISGSSCNLKCTVYSSFFIANKGLFNVVDLYTPLQRASKHLIENGVANAVQHPSQLLPFVSPCSFVYSSFDITIGSEELVFPTHVVSPWEIYIQLDRNTEIIERIMERVMNISEELMNMSRTDTIARVCVAKYSEDGKWYRSFVWPAQSSVHFNVLFVDYGSQQVVEKKNVLSIPTKAVDLILTPMQALRCSLSSVPEEEPLPEVNTWLEKATLYKGLRAKFVAQNNSGHFICDLFDGDVHINEKVREIYAIHGPKRKCVKNPLIDYCKGVSTNNKQKTAMRRHVESVVKLQWTQGHSNVLQANRLSYQKKSYNVKPSQKSHKLSSSAENGWSKVKNSRKPRKQQQRKSRTVPSTSKAQPSKVLPKVSDLPAIKITPGFRTVGFISHFDSVDSFFIQMQKDEQNILKMNEELFKAGSQHVTSDVNVGDLVAATYGEALDLYRAAVHSVAHNGYLFIEYIDYGNTATVCKRNVHPLASTFLSQARLSIHCKLSKPSDSEDVECFLSGTDDKPLMVEFVQNLGSMWEVSIQGLGPLHETTESDPAEVTADKVPDSGQGKTRQEAYTAVYDDGPSLISLCENPKREITNIEEDTRKLGGETKDGKVVKEEKMLDTVQAIRDTAFEQKSRTNTKGSTDNCDVKQDVCQSDLSQKPHIHVSVEENELLNILNNSHDWSGSEIGNSVEAPDSVGIRGKNVGIKLCQSVIHGPTSEDCPPAPVAVPPEKPMSNDDGIRRLYLAPVKIDHVYSGFAAAVTTPGEFYIVLEDLLLIMDAVSNVIEDLPADLAPLPDTRVIPGSGCLVKSEADKKWCRAEIIQCDGMSVIINLVDYGYCVRLACQDIFRLKALPVELAQLPKIAYPCSLRGVTPADELQWSDCAALFFQQCMHETSLAIHFRRYVSDAFWEVDVVASDRNVAEDLVDAGHAHYIDTALGIRFQESVDRKKELKTGSVVNVFEAVSGKREQTNAEKVPLTCMEYMSSNDTDVSDGCYMEGLTENPFSKSSDKQESAQETYDLQSRVSQCVSGLQ